MAKVLVLTMVFGIAGVAFFGCSKSKKESAEQSSQTLVERKEQKRKQRWEQWAAENQEILAARRAALPRVAPLLRQGYGQELWMAN